jgi:hypothetical protein
VREGVDPPPEARFDAARERCRARETEPSRQLLRRQSARQLQQGQRIASRLGDDLIPDPRIDRRGQRRGQQRARIGLPQPLNGQLRQPRQVAAGGSGPENQANRFRPEAAGNEREDLRRGVIEPLPVVDQANQRLPFSDGGQQAQHGQTDQKPVRRRPGTHAERGLQRITLRHREMLQPIQHR